MNATKTQTQQPGILPLVAVTTIFSGIIIGTSTNAVNSVVSQEYFRNTMRWNSVENIWRASIAQGILEGLIYGVIFSIVFTLVVGIVTRTCCSFVFVLQYLLAIVLATYCCWIVGGLLAMGLAILSPEFYRNTFIDVPNAFDAMLRYAWVGGSIWGIKLGSLLVVALGSMLFSIHWRRIQFENIE